MVNDGNQQSGGTKTDKDREDPANVGKVDRRTLLKTATGGMAVATMAGCTVNTGDEESPTDEGDGDGDDGTGTQQSIEGPLRIGVLAPVPSQNPIGASLANGARLAVKELNANGGVAGADVEIVVKDTKEDPATGRSKYQELTVGNNPVDATFGVFTSEVLLNIIDDIASQEVVHLTTGAATPEVSRMVNENYEKYKYHFRTGPINAHHLGVNMVDFGSQMFESMGWSKVAVLVEDYEWTHPVSEVLNDRLGSETDAEIVLNQRYAAGTENFSTIYDRVEEADADAAFTAMAHTGTPAVIQWIKEQRNFDFGGIHVPMQLPSYYAAVEGACRFGVTQNVATPQSEITDQTVPFSNAFKEEFGGYPVYTGYISYDAVKQWASVVAEVGSTAAGDVIPALEESEYTGTAGTITYYGPDQEFAHDVVYDPELVYPVYQQWQEEDGSGVQEVIFPEEFKTADYVAPPWVN